MFNALIAWSLRNRILVLAVALALTIAGAFILREMPVDVFPEFAPPQVVIQTEAPGLAPEDVESLITYPLESAINGTPSVNVVRSSSSVGLSTIVVVFGAGTDIYLDRQLVNERIQSAAADLPAGAKAPVMLPVTSAVGWLVKYSLTSKTFSPMDLRTISDWEIRPRLLAAGGVASVVSIGGDVKQYQVRLDQMRMLAYKVSAEDVRRALEGANLNVPGSFVQRGGEELIVSGQGRVRSLADLRGTVIAVRKDVPITLANVADVGLGAEVKRGDGAFAMDHAVIGTISKMYGADTVATTARVEQVLADIRKDLPAGITLDTEVFRQANFIEAAIYNLNVALVEGALIVIAVLFVFLMNWRASFITFLSMPLSFIGGLIVMYQFGVGINAMTLGGLAIAIGEVVDNGIITVENVVRRLRLNRNSERPAPAMEIVFDAVQEIQNSVVYATLIVSMIFVPIFLLPGLAGRIFTPLGIAYIASVLASLIVAITVIPALCYLMLVRGKEQQDREEPTLHPMSATELDQNLSQAEEHEHETAFVTALKRRFRRILGASLSHPVVVVGFALLLLASALALLPFFGRSFLPEFHEGNYIIAMTTLPGTNLDESMRLGAQVRKIMLGYKQVVSIDQRAGRSELDEDAQPPNFSEFDVRLDFERDPSMSADDLLRHVRADLNQIPGAVFNVGQFIAHRMDEVQSGVRAQVAIKLFGTDLGQLYRIGQQIQRIIGKISGAVDVNLEQQIKVPQVSISVDRERAARYGIGAGDVLRDVQMYLNGETVSKVLEGQRTFDLLVRLGDAAHIGVADVRDMLIDAPSLGEGGKLPLRSVASVTVEDKPYVINREAATRRIVVGFNVEDRDLGSVIADTQKAIASQIKLPPGYYIEYGGQFQSQQEANRVLAGFGALAVFVALILLYQAFGNLREALLVLLNLPLAMIGGVVGLFVFGADLSVAAIIGFITLFGIAARNGIILVTHYNQLRAEGKTIDEVVRDGTLDRLVPVLMTAATAALGLIPLLLGSPVGKELERPLAQVVLGGLVTSTLLNMVVIPTLYRQIELRRERRSVRLAPANA
ncbi:MAG: CusA/CzcA family heavy metal efflux RND transporter [Alphaproteobacteria bacterium]|nr:CusA/CzcA family heavy metal efflux RND transporter [Alphaproteobacteria bacterium]